MALFASTQVMPEVSASLRASERRSCPELFRFRFDMLQSPVSPPRRPKTKKSHEFGLPNPWPLPSYLPGLATRRSSFDRLFLRLFVLFLVFRLVADGELGQFFLLFVCQDLQVLRLFLGL